MDIIRPNFGIRCAWSCTGNQIHWPMKRLLLWQPLGYFYSCLLILPGQEVAGHSLRHSLQTIKRKVKQYCMTIGCIIYKIKSRLYSQLLTHFFVVLPTQTHFSDLIQFKYEGFIPILIYTFSLHYKWNKTIFKVASMELEEMVSYRRLLYSTWA